MIVGFGLFVGFVDNTNKERKKISPELSFKATMCGITFEYLTLTLPGGCIKKNIVIVSLF